MKKTKGFTLDNEILEYLDNLPARTASATVNRAMREYIDSQESRELVLVRGLPGSGKTTMAMEKFPNHVLLEADQYFCFGGRYIFKKENLPKAHNWCQKKAMELLEDNHSVVVANTFTTREEMAPYFNIARSLGCDIRVIVAPFNGKPFKSVHGVPAKTIEAMKARWEK